MMKFFFLILTAVSGPPTFAATIDSVEDVFLPSRIERVLTIQHQSNAGPSVKLVQVSNGTTEDPSRLYLAIRVSNEAYNLNANYLISNSVSSIQGATFNSKSKNSIEILYISLTYDQEIKPVARKVTVTIKDVLDEIRNTKHESDGKEYNLNSKIQSQ